MSPEKGRGKYPAPPYTPGENTPGRFGVRCRWRFGFFTCHRKMYFMCPIGQEHGTHPSTLPGTPPGLCRVPRYPSNPAPRHPRRGGVPVRGGDIPRRCPYPQPRGQGNTFFTFSGTRYGWRHHPPRVLSSGLLIRYPPPAGVFHEHPPPFGGGGIPGYFPAPSGFLLPVLSGGGYRNTRPLSGVSFPGETSTLPAPVPGNFPGRYPFPPHHDAW